MLSQKEHEELIKRADEFLAKYETPSSESPLLDNSSPGSLRGLAKADEQGGL